MELVIYSGGRWRRVSLSESRVSGWRRKARFAKLSGGLLKEISSHVLLNSLRKGPPLPTLPRKATSPTFKVPENRVSLQRSCEKSSKEQQTSFSRDASVQTDRESNTDNINNNKENKRPDKTIVENNVRTKLKDFDNVLTYDKCSTSKDKENKKRKAIAIEISDNEIPPKRIDDNDSQTDKISGYKSPVKKKLCDRKSPVKKQLCDRKSPVKEKLTDNETTERKSTESDSDESQGKELVIDCDDVEAVRNYIARNETGYDLLKFDTDNEYKTLVFFSINPLVQLERSEKIANILRKRQLKATAEFAKSLGLRSVTGSDSESEPLSNKRSSKRLRPRKAATATINTDTDTTDDFRPVKLRNMPSLSTSSESDESKRVTSSESESDSDFEPRVTSNTRSSTSQKNYIGTSQKTTGTSKSSHKTNNDVASQKSQAKSKVTRSRPESPVALRRRTRSVSQLKNPASQNKDTNSQSKNDGTSQSKNDRTSQSKTDGTSHNTSNDVASQKSQSKSKVTKVTQSRPQSPVVLRRRTRSVSQIRNPASQNKDTNSQSKNDGTSQSKNDRTSQSKTDGTSHNTSNDVASQKSQSKSKVTKVTQSRPQSPVALRRRTRSVSQIRNPASQNKDTNSQSKNDGTSQSKNDSTSQSKTGGTSHNTNNDVTSQKSQSKRKVTRSRPQSPVALRRRTRSVSQTTNPASGQNKDTNSVTSQTNATTSQIKTTTTSKGGNSAETKKILCKIRAKLPKRSSVANGREYTPLEDLSIISWLSAAPCRERQVNGNRVWRDLQTTYFNITGQSRSWHSLRNRYLRYILPSLGSLALPPQQAKRLRANAARGELKALIKKRRNSAIQYKPVMTAFKRQQLKDTDSESEPNRPRTLRSSKVIDNSSPEKESPVKSKSPVKSSTPVKSSSIVKSKSPVKSPRYSDVTRRFALRERTRSVSTPVDKPASSKKRRLFNPF